MKLIINPNGEQPIYEQIKLQIKEQIVSGELVAGEALPSIRTLAKELKVGVITAKRAYDDLTEEGVTTAIAGKGVFVSHADHSKLFTAGQEELKKRVTACVRYARANGVDRNKFDELVSEIWEEKK